MEGEDIVSVRYFSSYVKDYFLVIVCMQVYYYYCLYNITFALISLAEDLSFLFEKKDFKDRPRSTGTKSTLSLRLEQCPQQLNNPFNEYSKFDGKVWTINLFLFVFLQSLKN